MRRVLTAFALLAFALGLIAAPVPKEKDKVKDEDAIQGTWKIEELDTGGAQGAPPKADLDKMRLTFKKDGKMAMIGGPGGGESREGEYKLDPSAKLKTIDLTTEGRPTLGIYELDGDTLKMCIAEGQGAVRPEELKANGKGTMVVTLKRVKEEKKDK